MTNVDYLVHIIPPHDGALPSSIARRAARRSSPSASNSNRSTGANEQANAPSCVNASSYGSDAVEARASVRGAARESVDLRSLRKTTRGGRDEADDMAVLDGANGRTAETEYIGMRSMKDTSRLNCLRQISIKSQDMCVHGICRATLMPAHRIVFFKSVLNLQGVVARFPRRFLHRAALVAGHAHRTDAVLFPFAFEFSSIAGPRTVSKSTSPNWSSLFRSSVSRRRTAPTRARLAPCSSRTPSRTRSRYSAALIPERCCLS
jgi:hypothetical protein